MQTILSTGVDSSGAPILFVADTTFDLISIKFLQSYTRTTPQGAYILNYSGNIAPNEMPINKQNHFLVGDTTRVYRNEAAALVAAGIAAYS